MVRYQTRGLGVCVSLSCEDHHKPFFLVNTSSISAKYYCYRCRSLGFIELERTFTTGKGDMFKEVRVEHNFDPIDKGYKGLAIVKDTSVWEPGKSFTLVSPLIKTDKRALKTAEHILGVLTYDPFLAESDSILFQREKLVSFDDDLRKFSSDLNRALDPLIRRNRKEKEEDGSNDRTDQGRD